MKPLVRKGIDVNVHIEARDEPVVTSLRALLRHIVEPVVVAAPAVDDAH